MLGRQDHGLYRNRLALGVVFERDLALGVGSQKCELAGLSNLSLAFDETVGIGDRRGHQHIGLVTGVTKHQTLVTGALLMAGGLINALSDIRRLLTDGAQHGAAGAIETHG